jgi:hypothetical protein
MFNVYISCSVSRSFAGCCLLSLSSPFSSALLPNACFLHSGAGISLSFLAGVCVCARVRLYSVSPMPLVLKSSNQWWSFFFFANLINTESFLFFTEHWTENAKKIKMLKKCDYHMHAREQKIKRKREK